MTKRPSDNLRKAKANKKDEFYTQLVDIENELKHYEKHFKNKVVFCNCDDPLKSNFWTYFNMNFDHLGLKKLIATHFHSEKPTYKLEIINNLNVIKTPLKQNGDFRSDECIEILKEADIVVTNPPFSLFREYVAQLIEHNKKFLIIGNINAITYKEIFKLIKENKAWLGIGMGRGISGFIVPKHYELYGSEARIVENGERIVSTNNCLWITNLQHKKRAEELILYKKYTPEEYPHYDNYDAINVDKIADIPCDWNGAMGVPITFMHKFNPEQFEILALGIVGSIDFSCNKKMEILSKEDGRPTGKYTWNAKGTLYKKFNPKIDKKAPSFRDCETGELYSSIYSRIIIKKKQKIIR